jgi:hypothetical protein
MTSINFGYCKFEQNIFKLKNVSIGHELLNILLFSLSTDSIMDRQGQIYIHVPLPNSNRWVEIKLTQKNNKLKNKH